MANAFLYLIIVLSWGTTWIAIKYQTGVVPVENTIFYRFFIAAILIFLFLLIRKRLQPLKLIDHFFCVLQGACLFCFNFYFFYTATPYIETGLLSVIFSMATVFNIINSRLWYKITPDRNTVIGACIGILGILVLFYPDLVSALTTDTNSRVFGATLAVLGTFMFSLGNMITVRNNKHNISLVTASAWGMLYGSLIMLVISLIFVGDFSFDNRPEYIWSFIYLVVIGTLIAFTAYLSLISRIGANKTAYATVLFPMVALTISTFYEGYTFTTMGIMGLGLAIIGNIIVFYKPRKAN